MRRQRRKEELHVHLRGRREEPAQPRHLFLGDVSDPDTASAFKGGRPVDHVAAPRACTITQTVTKPPPKYPQFKGKTLTLTVYGSTPIVQLICQLARQSLTQAFDR